MMSGTKPIKPTPHRAQRPGGRQHTLEQTGCCRHRDEIDYTISKLNFSNQLTLQYFDAQKSRPVWSQ